MWLQTRDSDCDEAIISGRSRVIEDDEAAFIGRPVHQNEPLGWVAAMGPGAPTQLKRLRRTARHHDGIPWSMGRTCKHQYINDNETQVTGYQ